MKDRHRLWLLPKKKSGNCSITFPEDATWEDVQYSIYVRERVDRGRRLAEQAGLVDQKEIESRMKRRLPE